MIRIPFLGLVVAIACTSLMLHCATGRRNTVSFQQSGHLTDMQTSLSQRIDELFKAYLAEQFQEAPSKGRQSGWRVTLPSGRKVSRSFLQRQANPIIKIGTEAVPHLFKWVRNDNKAVRYIATYALEEITGLQAGFPYLADNDKEGNREAAIKRWQEWWSRNAPRTE